MGYITDQQLQDAADGIVRIGPGQPYSAWYLKAITRCNNRAFGIIKRVLASRGYSAIAIAAWADGTEFNLDLGLFFLCLESRNDLTPQAMAMLDNYDRRLELNDVIVTDATGTVIPPDADPNNPCGTGQITQIPCVQTPRGVFPSDWGYGNCGGPGNQGESCPGGG